MATRTMTGNLAIIRVGNIVIGKAQSINVNETFNRTNVRGLGEIYPKERPISNWTGMATLSAYLIDYASGKRLPGLIRRNVTDAEVLKDQLILPIDMGIQIDVYRRVEDFIDQETRLVKSKSEPFVVLRDCLPESNGMNIAEGQLGTESFNVSYGYPVIANMGSTEGVIATG